MVSQGNNQPKPMDDSLIDPALVFLVAEAQTRWAEIRANACAMVEENSLIMKLNFQVRDIARLSALRNKSIKTDYHPPL